ncbi:MAG: AAA family ATPase [Pseudomonadales bacterium]|nr:AAA family ATPase [Pseudomonadales bacterium]
MIIVVGGQKGGAGKSTVACNIAACLSEKSDSVLIVDADYGQPSAFKWAERRKDLIEDGENIKPIEAEIQQGKIKNSLRSKGEKYDYVIVDCPGRSSTEYRSALLVADLNIIPIAPREIELETLEEVYSIVDDARDINPKLKAIVLLNQCSYHPRNKKADIAAETLTEADLFPVLNARLCRRDPYGDSFDIGAAVCEWDNKKAIAEVSALMAELEL